MVSSVSFGATRLPGFTIASPARPSNGARDAREAEVQAGARLVGARGLHVRLGLLRLHPALVELALRDGALADQLLVALQFLFRQRDARLGAAGVGGRGVRGGPVLAAVDREQELALLDHAAFLVMDALQVARDARADLGRFDRLDVPAVFVPLGDGLLHDGGHVDVRRRHLLLVAAAAGGEQATGRQ